MGVGESRLDPTLHRACLYCATGTAVYSPWTRCLLSLRRVCVGVYDGVFCDAHAVRYAVTAFLTSPLNPTTKTLNGSSVFFCLVPTLDAEGIRIAQHCNQGVKPVQVECKGVSCALSSQSHCGHIRSVCSLVSLLEIPQSTTLLLPLN